MKVISTPKQNQNVYFSGYGKLVKEHYKITDEVINDVFKKAAIEKKDIVYALGESLSKDAKELKEACKESIGTIKELFDLLKKINKKFTQSDIKEILSASKLADKEGNIKNLPYKNITIHDGNDVIDDIITADTICDRGSREIKMLKGRDISVFNNKNEHLKVCATNIAEIINSTIHSVEAKNAANIKDSDIIQYVKCKNLCGSNISAQSAETVTVNIKGERNFINRIVAQEHITSHENLKSFLVKSINGSINIQGTKNNVEYIHARGDIRTINNVGELAKSETGMVDGKNNKISKIFAKEIINLENTKADIIESTNSDINLLGAKNIVDYNLKAKGTAKVQNLEAQNIFCKEFKNLGNVIVKGKLQTEQLQSYIPYEEIVDNASPYDFSKFSN